MFMPLVIARKFQDNEISIIKGILQFKYCCLLYSFLKIQNMKFLSVGIFIHKCDMDLKILKQFLEIIPTLGITIIVDIFDSIMNTVTQYSLALKK